MPISRRTFFGTGAAALGSLGLASNTAEAQLIYQHNDWKFAEFDTLLKQRARVKQIFETHSINDGNFLNGIKNSLNGLHFGFDIPVNQIQIVAALHGPVNILNFDDSMWAKYPLGEWLKLNDPRTGKPATRNPYFSKSAATSTDPEEHGSIYQDVSIEALQARGVKFLSCHNATTVQARAIVKECSLKISPQELMQDLQAHTNPGVLIVPAMVAAVALLQSEGHYSYLSA